MIRNILRNKKGVEALTMTIIVMILGLILFAGLLYMYLRSQGSFSDTLNNLGGSNVQTIVSACQTACNGNQIYDYCRYREVRFNSTKEDLSCVELVSRNAGLGNCDAIACTGCRGNSKCAIMNSTDCIKPESMAAGCTWK